MRRRHKFADVKEGKRELELSSRIRGNRLLKPQLRQAASALALSLFTDCLHGEIASLLTHFSNLHVVENVRELRLCFLEPSVEFIEPV